MTNQSAPPRPRDDEEDGGRQADVAAIQERDYFGDPTLVSIRLSQLTILYPFAWFGLTILTTLFTTVNNPVWAITWMIPLWSALIIGQAQQWFLARSLETAVAREASGARDTDWSNWSFTAQLIGFGGWILLWFLYMIGVSKWNVPFTLNHASGMAAFIYLTYTDSRTTARAWFVAVRRPGGVYVPPTTN